MTVADAIAHAETILPGTAAPDGEKDPRWQAIIAVGSIHHANRRSRSFKRPTATSVTAGL
jgi:hypothetical protein